MIQQESGRVLVTGANGFVGDALCRLLSNSRIPFTRACRLPYPCCDNDDAIVGDINGQTDWRPCLTRISTVVHLASIVHRPNSMNDYGDEYNSVNVHGSVNLARQAVEQGVRRFVYLSTIKVYGEGDHGTPFRPSDMTAPSGAYAISKMEAETHLRNFAVATGLELIIIRPPLIYGAAVRGNFDRLIQLVKMGVPLPFGMIKNSRSFVSVQNLVDLIFCCLKHPNATGQILLVRDGQDVSTSVLIRMMAQSLRVPARLFPVPSQLLFFLARVAGRYQDARRLLGSLRVDDSETRKLLHWHPPFTLEEGIRENFG